MEGSPYGTRYGCCKMDGRDRTKRTQGRHRHAPLYFPFGAMAMSSPTEFRAFCPVLNAGLPLRENARRTEPGEGFPVRTTGGVLPSAMAISPKPCKIPSAPYPIVALKRETNETKLQQTHRINVYSQPDAVSLGELRQGDAEAGAEKV